MIATLASPPTVAAGEMALFHEDLQRNCNVGALSICDIYRVNTSQIKPLLDQNPALQSEMMAIADSRVTINANIDHKVQSVASATCTHTAPVLHLHCLRCTCAAPALHLRCTCTAPALHIRSSGAEHQLSRLHRRPHG